MARLRPDPAKLMMLMGYARPQREVIAPRPEETGIGNADGAAERLTSAVSAIPVVIIDMCATRFCDCAPVRRISGLIGADRLLDLYPSAEAAYGAMPGQASAVQHLTGAGQLIPSAKTQIAPERESSAEGEV